MAQLPIMQGHDGGDSEAGAKWDAQAQFDIGVLISRYLEAHAPPLGAEFAGDFERWGTSLRERGSGRLRVLGSRHLHSVESA